MPVSNWEALAILLGAAAGARWIGSVLLHTISSWSRALGSLMCGLAAWLAVSAIGGWTAVWVILPMTGLGILLSQLRRRYLPRILADAVAIATPAVLSIPPLPGTQTVLLGIAFAGVGVLFDALAARASICGRALVTSALLALACALALHSGSGTDVRTLRRAAAISDVLYLAISPVTQGAQVVLDTQAVAWVDGALCNATRPAVVLFHGNDPSGSAQPSALVIRRALVDAGFVVIAVDHAGYGGSPTPPLSGPVDAWDPLPTVRSAHAMAKKCGDGTVAAVGHSMGVADVIRLLANSPDVAVAFMLGGGLSGSEYRTDFDSWWYERFLSKRRIDRPMERQLVSEIEARYYDKKTLLRALPPGHAPIIFGRFSRENADIVATRDDLFALLPGSKRLWDIDGSNHYLDCFVARGFVLGDARDAYALSKYFRVIREDITAH